MRSLSRRHICPFAPLRSKRTEKRPSWVRLWRTSATADVAFIPGAQLGQILPNRLPSTTVSRRHSCASGPEASRAACSELGNNHLVEKRPLAAPKHAYRGKYMNA